MKQEKRMHSSGGTRRKRKMVVEEDKCKNSPPSPRSPASSASQESGKPSSRHCPCDNQWPFGRRATHDAPSRRGATADLRHPGCTQASCCSTEWDKACTRAGHHCTSSASPWTGSATSIARPAGAPASGCGPSVSARPGVCSGGSLAGRARPILAGEYGLKIWMFRAFKMCSGGMKEGSIN